MLNVFFFSFLVETRVELANSQDYQFPTCEADRTDKADKCVYFT